MKHRTRAYWPTRIMLAAAILAPVAVALLFLSAPDSMGAPPRSSVDWVGLGSIAVGVALWLVGVAWMLRIFRGQRDEPPAWRYRDR